MISICLSIKGLSITKSASTNQHWTCIRLFHIHLHLTREFLWFFYGFLFLSGHNCTENQSTRKIMGPEWQHVKLRINLYYSSYEKGWARYRPRIDSVDSCELGASIDTTEDRYSHQVSIVSGGRYIDIIDIQNLILVIDIIFQYRWIRY